MARAIVLNTIRSDTDVVVIRSLNPLIAFLSHWLDSEFMALCRIVNTSIE